MRGYALIQLNRHDEAIRDFDEVIRFESHAKLFLLRGLSYQKIGHLERALQDFDVAVSGEAEAESFAARGLLYKEMGRREKAADDMTEAIRREPSKATYRTVRGGMFLELGREEAAFADYDEAVRLEPDKPEPYYFRGVGRLIAGRDGAGKDFRAVLRLKGWRRRGFYVLFPRRLRRRSSRRVGPPKPRLPRRGAALDSKRGLGPIRCCGVFTVTLRSPAPSRRHRAMRRGQRLASA